VYGVLRTADAVTPFLTVRAASVSLIVFCALYSFLFGFGTYYVHQLLRAGPAVDWFCPAPSPYFRHLKISGT
jgi:cytochrome d ubiquinol oxidase subunit I